MSPTVNCLIVGAQKSGTTALASFLAEHPDICVAPGKEVHLFDSPEFRDSREYCDARYAAAFPNFRGQRVVLEATPIYMYLPVAVQRMRRYNPELRVIAILRNPSARALSHYAMERGRRSEPLPLAAAFAAERFRLWRSRGDLSWGSAVRTKSYVDRGFYSRQIAQLLTCFPRDQLLLLRTDDLRDHHAATLEAVYRFLSIGRPETLPDAREIRPEAGDGAMTEGTMPSPMGSTLLALVYRREIVRLERLMGVDLSCWRVPLRPSVQVGGARP